MDRLASIEIFVRAVEKGGFTPVARDLGLSPTMVGKHIRALEDRLGTRLLNRTTRRQALTEAGALYYERCKVLLAEMDDADASVQTLRRVPRGVLRVACPVTFGVQGLVPALADYLAAHSEISVELTLADRAVDLPEEGFDAQVRIGTLGDSSLIACPLRPYRVGLYASPAYLERHGVPADPAALVAHNCLGFMYWDRRSRWRLTGPKGAHSVRTQGRLTVNSGQALRQAALAGIGIVMQPEMLFAEDVAAGRIRRILPKHAPASRPMHLVYPPERSPGPKLRSFIDFIVARFGPEKSGK